MSELMPYMNIFPTDPSAVEQVPGNSVQDGIADENVPNPPEDESQERGDAVEGKANDLLSDGISNSDASITNE